MDCADGNDKSSRVMQRQPGRYAAPAGARFKGRALFAAATAMGMVALSGEAQAVCTPVVAGEVLSCADATSNPAAFDATGDFTVTLEGDPNAAIITRDDDNAGLTVNAGDNAGDISMEGGASITTESGNGDRHGLVVTSDAAGTEKVYTIDIDGTITTSDEDGDALWLEGTEYATFEVFVGEEGILGNSETGGDEGLLVEGALDFSLENRGIVAGANGNGVQVREIVDDVRIDNMFGGRIGGYGNGIWIDDVIDDVAINNSFGGEIAGGDDGIDINDVGGDVRIANMFGGRIGGDESGIRIDDVDGDVAINNSFGGEIGGYDNGIEIDGVGGDVRIANMFGGRIDGDRTGIRIDDVEYDVAINNSFGGRIRGHDDNGIDLDEIDGDVSIVNRFGGRIAGDDNGIAISEVEDDVTIDNSFGGRIRGRDDDGIVLDEIDGDVSIANMFGGRITGDDDGVWIRDVEYDVAINNSFDGEIRGRDDDGIALGEIDGDVIIANMFGGRITGDDDGIAISEVEGDVAINNSFGGLIRGDSDGINLNDIDDDVSIANLFGRITGDDDGISIDDVESGDIEIYNEGGTIRGREGDGIVVTDADGMVTIENGDGRIVGDEHAIAIEADSVDIDSSGVIRGEGSEDSPTIVLSTRYGTTIDNRKGGLISGDEKSAYDLIIAAEGGEVEINNRGDMIGRIDLSSAGDTDDPNVVNNYSDDSWTFTGTSEFGDGFADEFNNTGTTHTTDPDDPSANDTTTLAGLESFNNGDAFNDGTLTMQDGYTGDVTNVTPTSDATLVFAGAAGHSYLSVDGFLGDAANSASDLLFIDGDVAGATGVNLADLNPGFGSYNPDGTVVIDVDGDTDAGDFFLVGGPVDKGLFQYDLALNPSNEWVLASAPNQRFFELPSLVSATQTMWQNSAGVWLDRTADLRSALAAPCVGPQAGGLKDGPVTCASGVTSGAWAKVLGTSVSTSQTHRASIFDNSYGFKVESQQRGYGVVAGYDFGREVLAANGPATWMFGVMAGYLQSNLDFDRSSTSADFEGGLVGGYMSYIDGGWFVDAKLVANIGDMDYSAHAMSTGVKDSANFTSIGGVVDTGYRFNSGATFIEPGATLSYVSTDLDRLSVFDSTVDFGNDDSLRGRLGVRVGTALFYERYKVEPFVGVSAWYEFAGDNTAGVESGGYSLTAKDDRGGASAEVSGGINLFSLNNDGLSAFLKGNVEFGENDLVGYGGHGGVRLSW